MVWQQDAHFDLDRIGWRVAWCEVRGSILTTDGERIVVDAVKIGRVAADIVVVGVIVVDRVVRE